ncbi:MAG: hypothetical protein DBX59_05800 [Bacillota bacterium]|nr:MAG: hypothetical protein DBX59_05800 [Bacillota bacterium]
MDYLGKLVRVLETLEIHLRNDTDPVEIARDKEDNAARKRMSEEVFPLLTQAQQKIITDAFTATESLYEYLMLRGKTLGFALGVALGTEAITAIEEFFCWD